MFIGFSKDYSFLQLWRKTCAFSLCVIYLLWFRFALLIFFSFLLYQQIKIWLSFFFLKQCFSDYGIRIMLAFCPCTWSWTIKIPYEFSLSLALAVPCSLWGLSSLTRDWNWALAVQAWSPKHWTARKFPCFPFINFFFVCLDHLFSIYLVYSKTS